MKIKESLFKKSKDTLYYTQRREEIRKKKFKSDMKNKTSKKKERNKIL